MEEPMTTPEFAHFPTEWHLSPILDTGDINQVKMYPFMAAFQGLIAEYYLERKYLTLNDAEASEWREARAQAEEDKAFFIAQPFHCAVGWSP